MSNALAIASVTAVLKDLLNDGLINANLDTIGQFSVTSVPPDQLDPQPGSNPVNSLNIYMMQAMRNAAWSNQRLPSRSVDGRRIDSPYLALDLYYILTATGDQELNAEILLGYGMQVLHETPVLTRDAIRTALAGAGPVDATLLPAAQQFLVASDLADQFEQLRITPAVPDEDKPMQLEALSNLWSAFSTPMRASSLYQISCVLIESRSPVRSALPVLTLGGRTAQIRSPSISRIRALPNGPAGQPDGMAPILPGSWIAVEGTALASDLIRLTVGGQPLTVQAQNVANGRIAVQLPANMQAGVATLEVEHLFIPEGGGTARLWEMSNAAALVTVPVLSSHSVTGTAPAGRFTGQVQVTLGHAVGADQTAALLFNPLPGAAEEAFSVRCDNRSTDGVQVTAQLTAVTAADYLLRVEIDGSPSQMTMGASGFDGPVVDLDP